MAQAFSKAFYNSPAWQAARRQALTRDGYTCAMCGRRATEVHHVVELTPDNINDRMISLDLGNLQSLCHKCHTELTAEEHGRIHADCDLGYAFDDDGNFIKVSPRGPKIY